MTKNSILPELIVGDNPFHGISHLSQERSRARNAEVTNPKDASEIVLASIRHGAGGFMFSVSATTLSILEELQKTDGGRDVNLYPIIPYAYEQVRESVAKGTGGLASSMLRKVVMHGGIGSASSAVYGAVVGDLGAIVSAYLRYEFKRLTRKSAKGIVKSIFLHEVVTDMALALEMDDLFREYYEVALKLGVMPGFETRNFARLARRLRNLAMPTEKIAFAAPFNTLGYQMSPSREECEKELLNLENGNVFAFSVLAGGYLTLADAQAYIKGLPNIRGVVIGASSKDQAVEAFSNFNKSGSGPESSGSGRPPS